LWGVDAYKNRSVNMINFEEELKKFQPSPEVEDIEDEINGLSLNDMSDIMGELLKEKDE
jgi:hypothetical protein